ncbi:protein translocase SEC61 complex subunit gamma [Nanoarchaeota archaeon]
MALARLKSFSQECLRVLKITKKPDKEEYKTVVKVTGLGIMVIGLLGLLLSVLNQLLMQ